MLRTFSCKLASSDVSIIRIWASDILQQQRCGSNWAKRLRREEEIKDQVFQYAGKNVRHADRVYTWGCATTGALGLRTLLKPKRHQRARTQQLTPQRIDFMDMHHLKARHVSCGYGFTVFLCEAVDGKSVAYGTGLNTDSQLGIQEYPRNSGHLLDYVIEPSQIQLPLLHPGTTQLTHVACGRAHTVIATDNEGVYTLGNNAHGQCGRPVIDDEVYRRSHTIHKLKFNEKIKQIVCGQDHTLFLTEEGRVYSCGLGADGQTGLGHYDAAPQCTLVKGDIEQEKIVHISSKADTVLAVSESGAMFGWGNCEYEQLGRAMKDVMQSPNPRHLPFKDVGRVTHSAAAGSMCALLNDEGNVFVWGFGILGKGPVLESSSEPQMIPPALFGRSDFNPSAKVIDIHSGLFHFAALTDVGDLYAWGKNRTACLGLGNVLDQFFPYKVHVPAEVRKIGCGVDHMAVLCKSFA